MCSVVAFLYEATLTEFLLSYKNDPKKKKEELFDHYPSADDKHTTAGTHVSPMQVWNERKAYLVKSGGAVKGIAPRHSCTFFWKTLSCLIAEMKQLHKAGMTEWEKY